jgi:hypothetical protein
MMIKEADTLIEPASVRRDSSIVHTSHFETADDLKALLDRTYQRCFVSPEGDKRSQMTWHLKSMTTPHVYLVDSMQNVQILGVKLLGADAHNGQEAAHHRGFLYGSLPY